MRLRNLFMILLLCMTVGMFGVSCTGDDGAQGPPGPAGPQGPPGDAADGGGDGGEVAEDTDFYPFLESWGVMDGEVGCSDSLLTGMGPLPGPAMQLPALVTTDTAINGVVAAVCSNTDIFGQVLADPTVPGLAIATNPANDSVVFVKTGRATDAEETVMEEEATTFSVATRTTTKKSFVEGLVRAVLEDNGKGDSFERELLYSDCGVGTTPPSINGIWRAAQITETAVEYEDNRPVEESDEVVETVTVTTKVCVQLDAHPGATKCYVQIDAPETTDDKAFVALYDGAELQDLELEGLAESGTAVPFFDADNDVLVGGNLCMLIATE